MMNLVCCFCKFTVLCQRAPPGWVKIIRSKWDKRSHLGWCPDCAARFGVE